MQENEHSVGNKQNQEDRFKRFYRDFWATRSGRELVQFYSINFSFTFYHVLNFTCLPGQRYRVPGTLSSLCFLDFQDLILNYFAFLFSLLFRLALRRSNPPINSLQKTRNNDTAQLHNSIQYRCGPPDQQRRHRIYHTCQSKTF